MRLCRNREIVYDCHSESRLSRDFKAAFNFSFESFTLNLDQ